MDQSPFFCIMGGRGGGVHSKSEAFAWKVDCCYINKIFSSSANIRILEMLMTLQRQYCITNQHLPEARAHAEVVARARPKETVAPRSSPAERVGPGSM